MPIFMRHLGSYCGRVGSLNVGTVTGKGVADILEWLECCVCIGD